MHKITLKSNLTNGFTSADKQNQGGYNKINEGTFSSRILIKNDFLSYPMGVEPMTFQILVECSKSTELWGTLG